MIEGGRALRCGNCGEVIGQQFGDELSEEGMTRIVARCYACTASEAGDRILAEASSEPTGEAHNG